jgi:glycosyltransferase involved in cell wall biosynthesis
MQRIKVKYVITHAIQYFVQLFQRLAERPELEFEVIYGTDAGAKTYRDHDFGKEIAWDLPMLTGYKYTVLRPDAPLGLGFWDVMGTGIRPLLTRDRTEVVIVHGWRHHLYVSAIATAKVRGLAVLNRMDSQAGDLGRPVLRWLKPLLIHPVLRRLDGHLVVGSQNRQYYLDAGVMPERLFWAPFSIDTALFHPQRLSPEEFKAREERLGFTPGAFRAIFVGKLIPRKRPADLIEALARMPSRQRTEALLVGDGVLLPELKDLARAKGVKVHFLGFRNQSEMPDLFALADVNVLPSSHDASPLAVYEGMSMGLTSIVSDAVGCGPDLVLDGRTGYVCKVGDVEGLARALEKMATDPGHLRQLKDAAWERIQEFTLERTVQGYLTAIQTVAAKARSRRGSSTRQAPRPGDNASSEDAD